MYIRRRLIFEIGEGGTMTGSALIKRGYSRNMAYNIRTAVSARGYNHDAAFRLGPVRRVRQAHRRQVQGRRRYKGGWPTYVILQNEANFLECWKAWIRLVDKVLAAQVRQFVTWLRFVKTKPKLGSFGVSDTRPGRILIKIMGSSPDLAVGASPSSARDKPLKTSLTAAVSGSRFRANLGTFGAPRPDGRRTPSNHPWR